jgi:hypothetical protein
MAHTLIERDELRVLSGASRTDPMPALAQLSELPASSPWPRTTPAKRWPGSARRTGNLVVKAAGHVPQTLQVASTPDYPSTVLAPLPRQ